MLRNISDRISAPLKSRPVRKIVLRILLPAVVLAAVLFALLSPPRFAMGDGYLFYPSDRTRGLSLILAPGGRPVLGPARIRLWGRYPWVYGTSDQPDSARFYLNLEDHSFHVFPESGKDDSSGPDEFDRFLAEHGFSLSSAVSWAELYTGPKERRLLLKSLLGRKGGRTTPGTH